MTFGDRLKHARLKKGYTQERLADAIGVAKSTLTGYEKGNREPDLFKIKKIVEVLEVDADHLLGTDTTIETALTGKKNTATTEGDGSEIPEINKEALRRIQNVTEAQAKDLLKYLDFLESQESQDK